MLERHSCKNTLPSILAGILARIAKILARIAPDLTWSYMCGLFSGAVFAI